MPRFYTPRVPFIALALLCSGYAIAQSVPAMRETADNLRATLNTLSPEITPVAAGKTAATGSRIIGYSNWKFNTSSNTFQPFDSTSYAYASAGNALYTQQTAFGRNGTNWVPKTQYAYTYNASGLLTGAIEQKWNSPTNSYVNLSRYAVTTNAAGLPATLIYSQWTSGAWVNSSRVTITYNASNKPAGELYEGWLSASSSWGNTYRYTYTRNAAGKTSSKLGEGWLASSSAWTSDLKIDSTYNAAGHLTRTDFLQWYNNAWAPSGRFSYTLDAIGRPISELNEGYQHNTSTYFNSQKFTFSYNAAGKVAIRTGTFWEGSLNTWSTEEVKVVFSYNSYDQPTSALGSSFKGGTWTFDGYSANEYWYYQTYTIASGGGGSTSVAGQQSAASLLIYPQPARDVLNISMKLGGAEDVDIAITDIQGRQHQCFRVSNTFDLNRSIYVGDMPSGHYIVSIVGSKNTRLSRIISVAH